MNILAVALCAPLTLALARSQSVTTALLGSPMTVGATGPGGVVQSATQSAGPLFAFGPFQISPFGGASTINWTTNGNSSIGTTIVLSHHLTSGAGSHFANGTFTVEYLASAPVTALLTIGGSCGGTSGAPVPTATVDLDADGSIDIPSALLFEGTATYSFALQAGQPRRVAVAMSSTVPAFGNVVVAEVTISLVPDDQVFVVKNVLGCVPSGSYSFQCSPSFADRGIDLLAFPSGNPQFVVLGLAMQPVLLPPFGTSPCLLVPRPDIVLFAPTGTTHVALPQSLRPVSFFAQGVEFGAALWPTDGYSVLAQ